MKKTEFATRNTQLGFRCDIDEEMPPSEWLRLLKTRLEELDNLYDGIIRKEIKPSEIVGIGYKNPRSEAFAYLYDRRRVISDCIDRIHKIELAKIN